MATPPPSTHQPRHSSDRPASQHSEAGEGPSDWHQRPGNRTIPAHSVSRLLRIALHSRVLTILAEQGNNDFEMTDLGSSSEVEARPVHRS